LKKLQILALTISKQTTCFFRLPLLMILLLCQLLAAELFLCSHQIFSQVLHLWIGVAWSENGTTKVILYITNPNYALSEGKSCPQD